MDIEKQQRRSRRKKILLACLGISLALHVTALFVFYKNPPSYLASMRAVFLRNVIPAEETLSDELSEALLEEVFDHFEMANLQTLPQVDHENGQFVTQVTPILEEDNLLHSEAHTPLQTQEAPSLLPALSLENTGSDHPLVESPYSPSFVPSTFSKQCSPPSLPFEWAQEPFQEEIVGRFVPLNEEMSQPVLPLLENKEMEEEFPLLACAPSSIPKTPPLMAFKSFQEPIFQSKQSSTYHAKLKELSAYDLPDVFSTIDWDAHFEIETEVMPDPQGEGFLFSISLQPIHDLSAKKMKQNFTFIIDRSNSIDKHYYEAFKKGVYRTLAYLPEGDTFNIVILDRKISQMSERPLPITKSAIYHAKQFLAKQEKSFLFSATEIYPMLEKALPTNCPDDEMNVAFIFSDGNTLLNLKKQKKALQKIIEKNHGKLTLHTAAAGISNNIVLLDLLSGCNRGSLFYTRTYASFPRKFVSSVLRLKDPLLKDISFSCLSSDPMKKIELYPAAYATPSLYHHEPYVILGKVESLDSLQLILEGRNGDQWVSIQKDIALNKAKKGQIGLVKKWEMQKARTCYENFLQTGNGTFLKEAKISLQTCSDFVIP